MLFVMIQLENTINFLDNFQKTIKELENLHNCIATLKDIQNDTLVITRLKQVA